MTCNIISVCNQKGGVGKTTTSVNLASALAEMGHRVLLIDLDPQANASSGMGLKSDAIQLSVYDVLLDPSLVIDALYPSPFENLQLIPSVTGLAGAEVEMMGLDRREFRLTTALEMLKSHYDYMIIDCAPSLGLLTINALVASSQALVPVQCEYYALEGVAKLLQTIRLVQNGLNADLDVLGILLTMYDPRTSLNQMVVNNARFHFKELVFKTVIPRNIRLAEAPSHGLPIILYDPKSRGAESYFNLAKEFKERVTAI